MRKKYNEAVRILQLIEQAEEKKTDTSWLNRQKVYDKLRAIGYEFRKDRGANWIRIKFTE